jgi:hypothetical protein
LLSSSFKAIIGPSIFVRDLFSNWEKPITPIERITTDIAVTTSSFQLFVKRNPILYAQNPTDAPNEFTIISFISKLPIKVSICTVSIIRIDKKNNEINLKKLQRYSIGINIPKGINPAKLPKLKNHSWKYSKSEMVGNLK